MIKPLRVPNLKNTPIIHLFLFTSTGHIVLFKRALGPWGPLSGGIEGFEKPIDAARRETKEEIGIFIYHIYSTDYSFFGVSPKGKRLHGITCLARLPKNIGPECFTFNDEISRCVLVSPSEALLILRNRGFPEGLAGLLYLMKHGIINRHS